MGWPSLPARLIRSDVDAVPPDPAQEPPRWKSMVSPGWNAKPLTLTTLCQGDDSEIPLFVSFPDGET